jgi:hypothetical protein
MVRLNFFAFVFFLLWALIRVFFLLWALISRGKERGVDSYKDYLPSYHYNLSYELTNTMHYEGIFFRFGHLNCTYESNAGTLCIHVCVCISIYNCTYVCLYKYVHVFIYTNIYLYKHLSIQTFISTNINTCTSMYITGYDIEFSVAKEFLARNKSSNKSPEIHFIPQYSVCLFHTCLMARPALNISCTLLVRAYLLNIMDHVINNYKFFNQTYGSILCMFNTQN